MGCTGPSPGGFFAWREKNPGLKSISRPDLGYLVKKGEHIYGVYEKGIFVVNTRSDLSIDFSLNVSIIGNKINYLALLGHFIWIVTDLGVSRVERAAFLP